MRLQVVQSVVRLAAVAILVGCSSPPPASNRTPVKDDGKNDDSDTKTSDSTAAPRTAAPAAPTTPVDAGTPPAAAQTFPRAAGADECALGNGHYCGGNGVDGDTATLYRCVDGMIEEDEKCTTTCHANEDHVPDACD